MTFSCYRHKQNTTSILLTLNLCCRFPTVRAREFDTGGGSDTTEQNRESVKVIKKRQEQYKQQVEIFTSLQATSINLARYWLHCVDINRKNYLMLEIKRQHMKREITTQWAHSRTLALGGWIFIRDLNWSKY